MARKRFLSILDKRVLATYKLVRGIRFRELVGGRKEGGGSRFRVWKRSSQSHAQRGDFALLMRASSAVQHTGLLWDTVVKGRGGVEVQSFEKGAAVDL